MKKPLKKSATQSGGLTHQNLNKVKEILTEKEEVEKLKLWAAKVSEKVGIKF